MGVVKSIFEAIPAAALSPLALIAYLGAIICTMFICFRTARLKTLLGRLELIPEPDRRPIVERELGPYPLDITAEQYIRLKRQIYIFIWCMCVLGVIIIVVAIGAATAHAEVLQRRDGDIAIVAASDDAREGRVPIGAEFAVSVQDLPGAAAVTWGRPSHGAISPERGPTVRYRAQTPGPELLKASIDVEGHKTSKSLSFEVVNPF